MARQGPLCIATSFDAAFADIGVYCAAAAHHYAARWQHDLRISPNLNFERPPAWHRLQMIRELFDEGYRYVLWVDADSIFVRLDADVLAELRPNKDLYLVEHTHPAYPSSRVPNTGVMLLRNSGWSRNLLQRLWNMTDYLHHPWWENAALIDLLGYRNLLGTGEHSPDGMWMNRVQFLADDWNHIPSICSGGNPIIRHYAGISSDVRRAEMPLHAMRLFRAEQAARAVPPGGAWTRFIRAMSTGRAQRAA